MMKRFALKFLVWRTKHNLKSSYFIKRSNVSYPLSKKVGVIFSVKDIKKHEGIKHLVHILEQDKKEVTVLSYLGKGKENFEFRFDYFSLKDLSFFGQIKSESVNSFINTKFDFIFHIDPDDENILIDNILVQSKAAFRIGTCMQVDKSALYELIYKPRQERDFKEIVEEVLNYTKALTKHDTNA